MSGPFQDTANAQQDTVLQPFLELLDFRHLVFESILHPIEAFNAYTPSFTVTMVHFTLSDIPDLTGKVILVTGGVCGLRNAVCSI